MGPSLWLVAAVVGAALTIIMHDFFGWLERQDYQRHFED